MLRSQIRLGLFVRTSTYTNYVCKTDSSISLLENLPLLHGMHRFQDICRGRYLLVGRQYLNNLLSLSKGPFKMKILFFSIQNFYGCSLLRKKLLSVIKCHLWQIKELIEVKFHQKSTLQNVKFNYCHIGSSSLSVILFWNSYLPLIWRLSFRPTLSLPHFLLLLNSYVVYTI